MSDIQIRVVVGMSGGVDSSVTALLLKTKVILHEKLGHYRRFGVCTAYRRLQGCPAVADQINVLLFCQL